MLFRFFILTPLLLVVLNAFDHTQDIANKNPYFKDYQNKPCLECNKTSQMNASSIMERYDETNDTVKKYNIQINRPDERATSEASKVDTQVRSEKAKNNVHSMENKILREANYTFDGDKTNPSPWKKAYEDNKIYSIEEAIVSGKTKEQILAPRERIYVVVSSSMPDVVVKEYLKTIKEANLNKEVQVVLRGMVGGMKKFTPTKEYISRLISTDELTGVEIHPKIVSTYGIEMVPAVLYIKDYDPINEAHQGQSVKSNEYYIVYGAVSLETAIKEIAKTYDTKGLAKVLSRLNGEGIGFHGKK